MISYEEPQTQTREGTHAGSFPHPSHLPDWGPYSKTYIGVSHVAEMGSGRRFDLSLFPGIYRRDALVPNVRQDTGYVPWQCAPDLSWYSHRHAISGLDDIYADISFSKQDDGRTFCTRLVNNTHAPTTLSMYLLASMAHPPRDAQMLRDESNPPLRMTNVNLPEGGLWIGAEAYDQIRPEAINHLRHLPYAGELFGTVRKDGLVSGQGIGSDLFISGCRVTWRLTGLTSFRQVRLVLRYQLKPGGTELQLNGITRQTLQLKPSDTFAIVCSEPFDISGQEGCELEIQGQGLNDLVLDGFAIVDAESSEEIHFSLMEPDPVPEIVYYSAEEGQLVLAYRDLPGCYGLAWDPEWDFGLRRYKCDNLDRFLKESVNNNVIREFGNSEQSCFENVLIQPIPLPAQSEIKLYGYVGHGSRESIMHQLAEFRKNRDARIRQHEQLREGVLQLAGNPAGTRYQLSQERMAANVLCNIVYPISCRGKWIKHLSPGRWWDRLYTWDSGFTALGLAELDPGTAISHINTYLAGPDEPDQAAFVHYGTPVPTQIYAFKEIWNKHPDPECLDAYFPKFLHYYRFFTGKLTGASTNHLGSNLVTTWDYFYNSGGWDDYPPQQFVHEHKLTSTVAPIINTAHTIRFARILKGFADIMGLDSTEFDVDIARYSKAIQQAWDQESGYFGYLCHDKLGHPTTLLRHPESTANYNMGMDGLSPLIAGTGSISSDQADIMCQHLMSPRHLWTPIGLTTVSQAAPYYRRDGYWNGAVWMPHQWFFWKALLDFGDGDSAYKIAKTALDTWATEVGLTHRCFEHFIVESGRGAGWHHFSGLSSPVLSWYTAYFRPGTLTVGHDGTVLRRLYSRSRGRFEATIQFEPGVSANKTLLLTLPEGQATVQWNGHEIQPVIREKGCLEIRIQSEAPENRLLVLFSPTAHD